MNYILKYDFDPVNNCGIICFTPFNISKADFMRYYIIR